MDYFELLLSIVFAGIPILLWGYVFAYFDGTEFELSQFTMGIIAWGFGVLPIAYSTEIAHFFHTSSFIGTLWSLPIGLDALPLYSLWFFVPVSILMLFLSILHPHKAISLIRPIAPVIFGAAGLILGLALMISQVPNIGGGNLSLQGTVITSLSGIIIAYIFIASIEEALKHVSSYISIVPRVTTAKQILLVAIYSALGFVFIENILYLSGIVSTAGADSSVYYSTLFSRSIISLLLHVFASLILALGFVRYLSEMTLKAGVALGVSFMMATVVHALFNIALTYGKVWIVALYGIVLYFFMTKIFLDERTGSES
jgi:RsiW-degrading membrane proteinase PrsW (M82 family)